MHILGVVYQRYAEITIIEKAFLCPPFGAQRRWGYYWKHRFEILRVISFSRRVVRVR